MFNYLSTFVTAMIGVELKSLAPHGATSHSASFNDYLLTTIHSIKSLNKLITSECDYPPKGSFQTILYHIIRVYSRPWLVPYHLVPRCNYKIAVYFKLYCRKVEFNIECFTSWSALFEVGRWKVPAATIYHWQTQLYRDKPREIGGQTNWNSDFSGVHLFVYLSVA